MMHLVLRIRIHARDVEVRTVGRAAGNSVGGLRDRTSCLVEADSEPCYPRHKAGPLNRATSGFAVGVITSTPSCRRDVTTKLFRGLGARTIGSIVAQRL